MTNPLIANFLFTNLATYDDAFIDDEGNDTRDALDCDCVPFDDAIDTLIAEQIEDYAYADNGDSEQLDVLADCISADEQFARIKAIAAMAQAQRLKGGWSC